MRYTRLFNDVEGGSHFEELSVPFEVRDFAPPTAPVLIAPFLDTAHGFFFRADPSWAGDVPHPSPQRQVFCVLAGAVEATTSDGASRILRPGDVVVVDDTEGVGHSTRVVGDTPLLMFGAALADQTPHPGPTALE